MCAVHSPIATSVVILCAVHSRIATSVVILCSVHSRFGSLTASLYPLAPYDIPFRRSRG